MVVQSPHIRWYMAAIILLQNKYLGTKPLAQIEWKIGGSHFWSGLVKVKLDFVRIGSFIVKDGSQLEEDKWLGNAILFKYYPFLYNIARLKHISIAEILRCHAQPFLA